MDNHTKGSEQPTSEKKYKSPHRQFGQNDNCPKKIHKIYKTVEMYSTQKNELNIHKSFCGMKKKFPKMLISVIEKQLVEKKFQF